MKNNFFKNITKNNLNNNLEHVLSKKSFSEETKNILLSMFYKIENGYNDYKTVKRDTYEKKVYIQKLIDIIDKDCEKIEFLKQNDKSKEVVNKENKEIICYPIETQILYLLAKIQKKNVIVKYIDYYLEKAFSFVLNTGNNINIVEPLRDFNGFSWNVVSRDIEDINCNIIYQNMIFLMGNEFLDKWANNYNSLVDYFDIFQSEIEQKYGKKIKDGIVNTIMRLSIIINSIHDKEFEKELLEKKEQIKSVFEKMENTEEYLINITKLKRQKEKELKQLDQIINNKDLLAQEYTNRNNKLPLENKIFSIRVLKNALEEERINIVKEIENYSELMKPKEFLSKRENISKQMEILKVADKNTEEKIHKLVIELQKYVIKCLYKNVQNANNKQDIIELIYKYRYYCYIPISTKKNINEEEKLKKYLEKLGMEIIKKAIELKAIHQITEDTNLNYKITRKILLSKIISLEDINIKITENKESAILKIYDEEIEDAEMTVKKEKIKVKVNKKIKFVSL